MNPNIILIHFLKIYFVEFLKNEITRNIFNFISLEKNKKIPNCYTQHLYNKVNLIHHLTFSDLFSSEKSEAKKNILLNVLVLFSGTKFEVMA